MWPFDRADKTEHAIPTFSVENTIGRGTCVRGDVGGPGGFRIDGSVEGSIDAEGPVVIGENGVVDGAVRGRDVVVLGRVRGDVVASGHLEIGPKGKIVGDITVKSFRMHTGGVFRGMSCMPAGEETRPHLLLTLEAKELARGRTLPPPNGAVPPPPTLAELAAITPLPPIPDEAASQQRLITSGSAPETMPRTGT